LIEKRAQFELSKLLPFPVSLAVFRGMDLPQSSMTIERRVAFAQTDAAGLIHFSTYFAFMEAAEAELLRTLKLPLLWEEKGVTYGFPRVDCQCSFRRPVSFDDLIRIELKITEITANRIAYAFVFTGPNGKTCAEGTMVTAFARRDHSGRLESADLPEATISALEGWKNAGK
jgi:YbgC/YbaW family acyl-CoA thioester hydrolase